MMDLHEYDKALQSLPRSEKPAFQKWFVEYQEQISWEEFKSQGFKHVVEIKEAIEKHVAQVTGKPKQLQLAFMPTEMARTSPFHPMSRKEMKNRPQYQNFTIQNAWGRITISGPKLSIYDESVLLGLLLLAKKHKKNRFQTTYAELCDLMNVSRGANPYKAIGAALKRLAGAVVDTELYSQEQKKEVIESVTGVMVTHVRQQEKTSKVDVEISPYFLALYGANLTTALDVEKRADIKGDTAKALYRFLQTHRPSTVPFGLITLCHGINLNTELPLKEIRRQFRTALSELKRKKHIGQWKIDRADNVHITTL